MIQSTQLPARAGYVEVVNEAGEHIYQATKEQKEKLELIEENILLKAQVKAITQRSDFMEDCVAEMAALVYV